MDSHGSLADILKKQEGMYSITTSVQEKKKKNRDRKSQANLDIHWDNNKDITSDMQYKDTKTALKQEFRCGYEKWHSYK